MKTKQNLWEKKNIRMKQVGCKQKDCSLPVFYQDSYKEGNNITV